MKSCRFLVPLCTVGLVVGTASRGSTQVTSVRSGSERFDRDSARAPGALADPTATANAARNAQLQFEQFRRANLPESRSSRGGGGGSCDEQVGRFCYWYDEKEPPPPREPDRVREARKRLIAALDSAAAANPSNAWVAAQRVRYLVEDGRSTDAVAAAFACKADGWRCTTLVGFAYHEAGDYVRADSAYQTALRAMSARERCDWEDISLLLDEELLPKYRAQQCGDSARLAFERRVWWLARPLFSTRANDARTEHYARLTMVQMITEAPSAHEGGFDEDERELLLRYSWPRAWSRSGGGLMSRGGGTVGHEPTPAYPYLPNAFVYDNPVNSDSLRWTTRPGVVHARYAPAYAMPLQRLEHQSALFRRGDSALVVLAYDLRSDSALAHARDVQAALVLTQGEERDATIVHVPNKSRGVITAYSVWASMLMSAEVTSPTVGRSARARYGIRPPYAVGVRVSLSDLLLFEPYGSLPTTLTEVVPHAMQSLRVRGNKKVGFYWEAYGTNPAGEMMNINVTVAPEVVDEPTKAQRLKRALRVWKEAKPVSVQVQDVSARGQSVSPRSVEVDLSTLPPGPYLVELEIEVAKQYHVRAERRIVVE